MANATRRNLTMALVAGGSAATAPSRWTKPVVEAVVLPAHAQTSQCVAPAGCYNVPSGSVTWPGGNGPLFATTWPFEDCTGSTPAPAELVVASSLDEAASLLSCSDSDTASEIPTDPPLPEGCNLYVCSFVP